MGANPVIIVHSGRRGRSSTPATEKPSFRERMNALRYVPQLLSLVWNTHRGFTIAMAVLRLVRAFVPIATLWIGKLIIDGVVTAQRTGASWRSVASLVAIEVAIVIVGELLARASSLVESLLGDL